MQPAGGAQFGWGVSMRWALLAAAWRLLEPAQQVMTVRGKGAADYNCERQGHGLTAATCHLQHSCLASPEWWGGWGVWNVNGVLGAFRLFPLGASEDSSKRRSLQSRLDTCTPGLC